MADAGGGSSAVPPAGALRPAAHADVRGLEPGAGGHGEFNAYDFEASWNGSMLQLVLIEDEMRSMRGASKPHRNRRITVGTCPVEPHHALQSCGDPIWSGSRMLADRLELPPIPLAECGGWIVVSAAELSDDLYDGWRNAPCPNPDGGTVGSDGSGETWPEYPEPPAAPRPPETVQSNVDAELAAGGGLTAGGAPRSVGVSDLFENAGGTTGDQYSATSSDETVATVEVTDNPRVVITPVGAGTATIEVTFLESGEQVEFDVTVGEPAETPGETNAPPAITNPGNKQYSQVETITAFGITVSDPDGDEVTVTVTGLPSGLSWSSGQVSGTVAENAAAQSYTVTVRADDGMNDPVTATFTITITMLAETVPRAGTQGIVDAAIAAAGGLAPPVRIAVSALFAGTEGTEGGDYRATSSDPAVVTVGITSNPQLTITRVGPGTATIRVTFLESGAGVEFDVTAAPAWILLADSLTAMRNLGNTGAGPDNTDNGPWPLRWIRFFYREGEPRWTIAQAYSEGSWASGGTRAVACQVTGTGVTWSAGRLTSGAPSYLGTTELLASTLPMDLVLLDSAGNPQPRVPTGYDDDPDRLWVFRFQRTDPTTSARLSTECKNNTWMDGEIYYMDVPFPPQS